MRQVATVVTRKGQITVPVEVRRSLGLQRGDKVVFLFDKKRVRLQKGKSVVERTAGSMRAKAPLVSAEREREITEALIAEAAEERSR
ncbi:MAG: AbrB/MazE/SpoVT family DNA-binding domain-containing protein [Chloroflexi bacterium]|nr:AbrB/MazE/SpoVT family DNA-binding domain-containing protein [Chloroflexota bacterium]